MLGVGVHHRYKKTHHIYTYFFLQFQLCLLITQSTFGRCSETYAVENRAIVTHVMKK